MRKRERGEGEGRERERRREGRRQEGEERRVASFKLKDEAHVWVYPIVLLGVSMAFVEGRCWSSGAPGCC